MTLDEQNFDLYSLLNDVHDLFELKAKNKQLQFYLNRSDTVPRYIRSDGQKLRQVLINLLSNAFKFTKEGEISLDADVLTEETVQTKIVFTVEDTGDGIAENELDKIFEPFVQSATGKTAPESTGLGLSISRKFVQLMGGDLSVSSAVGKGSVFTFTIRAQIVSAAESTRPHRRVIALEPNQPRYRILIVDDEWTNRQLLIKLLNPLGFELREAKNGEEAIDIWEEWQPQMIWMDMRMPVMDGYEATRQIKAHTKGQATAIIALTANVLEENRAVVLSAGCDDFLQKPFKKDDIFELMHKHLGVRYMYEDSSQASEPDSGNEIKIQNLNVEVTKLPDDLLAELQDAVECADLEAMRPIIERIDESDKPLAKALSKLADGFCFDILQEVFEEKSDFLEKSDF